MILVPYASVGTFCKSLTDAVSAGVSFGEGVAKLLWR